MDPFGLGRRSRSGGCLRRRQILQHKAHQIRFTLPPLVAGAEAERKQGALLLRVREDIGTGVRLGVQSAPVIFVNGIYFGGTFPLEDLRALVRRELEGVREKEAVK